MNEKLQEIIASLKRSNEKYTIIGDVNVGLTPMNSAAPSAGQPESPDSLTDNLNKLIKKLDSKLENFGKGIRRSLFDISKIGEPFKNFAGGIQSLITAPIRAVQESVSAVQETFASIGSGIKNAIGGIFSRFSVDKEKLAQTELLSKISVKINEQSDSITKLVSISQAGFDKLFQSFRSLAEILRGDELQQIENQRKNFALFTDISESLGGIEKSAETSAEKADDKGGLFGFLPVVTLNTLRKFASTALKGAGIAGLVTLAVAGIFGAVQSAFEGYDWASEIGVEGISGAIGGFLGGSKESKSIINAIRKASEFAGIGAAVGVVGGIPGIIGGALVGAGVGGILGWIGGENIAEFMDPVVKKMKRLLGAAIDVTEEELIEATNLAEDMRVEVDRVKEQIKEQARLIREAVKEDKPEDVIIRLQEDLRKSYDELAELETERQQAIDNQLQIERDMARNEKVAARQKVDQIYQEQWRVYNRQQQIKMELRLAKEGSEEHQNLLKEQENLNAIRASVDRKRKEADEELSIAKENLLETDRKIVKKAREAGRAAPIGAQFNVMMGDIRDWFKNNIYDGGPPKRIFGVELPSFEDIGEGWQKLKEKIGEWWKNNIYDASGDRVKVLGVAMPTLSDIGEGWQKLKEKIGEWWKNNIYDASGDRIKVLGVELPTFELPSIASIKETLLSWLPWPFNKNKNPPEEIDLNEESEEARARAAVQALPDTTVEDVKGIETIDQLNQIAQKLVDSGAYDQIEKARSALGYLIKSMEMAPALQGSYQRGTQGFVDFGRESLAKLHGVEAVIPRESPQGRLVEVFSSPRERRIDQFVDVITTMPRNTGIQMESTQRETDAFVKTAMVSSSMASPTINSVMPYQGPTTNNNTRFTVNQANHIDPTMKSVLGNSF